MDYESAENIANQLALHLFHSEITRVDYQLNGGNASYYTVIVWKDGNPIAEVSNQDDLQRFLQVQGLVKRPRIRYLYCTVCGKQWSADPQHYRGTEGHLLSCCGRALRLRVQEGMDAYTVADSVDVEYLSITHSDQYRNVPPLPTLRAPSIPQRLQLQKWDPAQAGYMLWLSGYRRQEGLWLPVDQRSLTVEDLTRFEDGDRVQLREEDRQVTPNKDQQAA